MKKNIYDILIVGQGLAGSMLAEALLQRGQNVLVIDKKNRGITSSSIASGVINPITGMRFVKSWRIDDFLPVARKVYQNLEKKLSVPLWSDKTILRTIRLAEDENNWLLRAAYPENAYYFGDLKKVILPHANADIIKLAEIKNGAQVNVPLLIKTYRHYLRREKRLIYCEADAEKLQFFQDYAVLNGICARKIIFCEGERARFNPFFKHLPFTPDKGELIIAELPAWQFTDIVKDKFSIVPLAEKNKNKPLFWIGATDSWTFNDAEPTPEKRDHIEKELKKMLPDFPEQYKPIKHLAAIRPTVKDRRPLIGFHPAHPRIGIFNGFGTKGASLAPYWAAHFADVLTKNILIDKAVDIVRFF